MRSIVSLAQALISAGCLSLGAGASAAELARFEIGEPLGQSWTDEWLTQDLEIAGGAGEVSVASLDLRAGDRSVPAQFYSSPERRLLDPGARLRPQQKIQALFCATVPRNQTVRFVLSDAAPTQPSWEPISTRRLGSTLVVDTGVFEVAFDPAHPLPINAVRCCGGTNSLGVFRWPAGIQPTGVLEGWLERGPAQATLRRSFEFEDPARRYEITFTFRAGDPWLDISDAGTLGKGSALEIDLRGLRADTVYHPYAYNARTFRPGGPTEDSTLQPPQHPIATLGPIWRDIWYNGGPFAFVYRSNAVAGLGFAAVRGSQWRTPDGISPESQNLEIHGDRAQPGQVFVRIGTDGVLSRRWALIVGSPELRKSLSRLTRSHADIPLEVVRHEWILEWPSDAPEFRCGAASSYLAGHFNQHQFNPTTFPRSVRRQVEAAYAKGRHVKSRDLAVLAYVFTNPDYWPGPKHQWRIGNPNFHTDMYNIPLKIGLLMPDHPHARRWTGYGVEETYGNLMRDSFPGGAWAESISYSSFFYHVAENVRLLRDYGVTNGFEHWPRLKEVATYLAAMHTPVDTLYGTRQKAAIGDTSPGDYVKETRALAADFRGGDPSFAEQLARFPDNWEKRFDLSSRRFPGFGAMLRGNAYDERHESFVTVKAGPARNHYQGDELSFHFCGLGTPLAIDHACHYSPRPWSAAMHNRPDMDNKRPVAVAEPRAFRSSSAADVFVADERTTRINEVPIEPHLTTKPGWEYPTTSLPEDKPWTMRRYVMLVKHDPQKSRLADYLVVRDEIVSPEPVWWNLHLLARSMDGDRQVFRFPGQLDVDLTAHFLSPTVSTTEKRQWGWSGNSGKRRDTKGAEYERSYFGNFIPKDFTHGTWKPDDGERTMWLRVRAAAGRSEWLVLLMPNLAGRPAPKVEKLSATSARISLGDESETVWLGTDGPFQAAVDRAGNRVVLLSAGTVKGIGRGTFSPLSDRTDRGGL